MSNTKKTGAVSRYKITWTRTIGVGREITELHVWTKLFARFCGWLFCDKNSTYDLKKVSNEL